MSAPASTNKISNPAALRDEVVRALSANPRLSAVTVLAEDRLDLTTEIAKALGRAKGIVIVVVTGAAKGKSSNLPIAQATIDCLVEIAEIPAINRSPSGANLPAIDATLAAVETLHHFQWCHGRTLVFASVDYDMSEKLKMQKYTITLNTDVSFESSI